MSKMHDSFDFLTLGKALAANTGSWTATVFGWMQGAQTVLGVLATVCSISVSVATILWIRKQMRAFDEKQGK